ncbi:MAG: site-specific integrase [Rikenellaceae bacterium]
MKTRFYVIFYVRKKDNKEDGTIYCRLTVNGKAKNFSINESISLSKWDAKCNRCTGSSKAANECNKKIDDVRSALKAIEREFIQQRKPMTADAIMNRYNCIDERTHTVVSSFEYHNEEMKKMIGKTHSASTLQRYTTAFQHVCQFMEEDYGVKDIPLVELDLQFADRYKSFLRTRRGCCNNSMRKYFANFHKVIRMAVGYNWLLKDPFLMVRIPIEKVEKCVLTMDELKSLKYTYIENINLDRIRDVFLFGCMTGFAYSELFKLTRQNIIIDDDGTKWLEAYRTKTGILEKVLLLEEAERIIEKYANDPICAKKGQLIPILSNQKYNSYLKIVADFCGINKEISSHTARHTYATTVTLENGVPIETVSKTLGHTNTRMTAHYAKTTETKIKKDMKHLIAMQL